MRSLLLASLALLSLDASAQNWQSIGEAHQGTMYLDISSIRQQGKFLKAWSKWVANETQQNEFSLGKPYKVTQTLHYYDCESLTVAQKQIVLFDDDVARNTVTSEYRKDSQLDFRDPVPGTFGDSLTRRVCRTKR